MMMKDQQVHALRACSLVVIPPSEERMPPPGGFPRDLSGMNLTSWAGLIQDVAQGMKVVPPNLAMEVCLDSMVLLQLLEATTGMGYCRICCQPSPRCHCIDDMEPDDGQDARARSGGLHWRPYHSWNCHRRGTRTGSASASTWPPPTGLDQLEPTSHGGSSDWGTTDTFRRSAQHWKTDSRPTGLGSKDPGTAYAGSKRSPGNAASSSAEAAPACYPLSAGSTATEPACYPISASSAAAEPAHYSLRAGGAAIKPACYTIPAGCAAAQEANRKGIVSLTYLRQSRSCSQPNHPRMRKATGQGTGRQRQISQSPRMRLRDDNQCSLDYHPGRHPIPTQPSFPAWMPRSG